MDRLVFMSVSLNVQTMQVVVLAPGPGAFMQTQLS